jgi:saccharopine dehydrogenase-like NADP-dependent oxidoreductase
MKQILVFGAGRSASSLIHYFLEKAEEFDWFLTVADASAEAALKKVGGHKRGEAVGLDVKDASVRGGLIEKADVVVSLMPPNLHHFIAEDCIKYRKNLATASYVSEQVQAFDVAAREKELLFLCEMGLDPGIDHMSAMQLIDNIKKRGGKITSFKSGAGGLVAAESDNNPWHYKFSWAPRNVVLAGQGVAKYQQAGKYKHIPYHRLFAEAENVEIQGMGLYEAYPNRISLKYEAAYGLKGVPTILRQTIRHKGYCKAWNLLVQLGLTDDSYQMDYSEHLSYASLVESFLPADEVNLYFPDLRARVAHFFGLDYHDEAIEMLDWLDLFKEIPINFDKASPADILQHILEYKWKLEAEDKDMIIMQHEVDFEMTNGTVKKHYATMIYKGDDAENTAMSKLVGLPLAIGVKNILLGNYNGLHGVHIPILPQIYEPVMNELLEWGVRFEEKVELIS